MNARAYQMQGTNRKPSKLRLDSVNLSDSFKAVQNETRREVLKMICDSDKEGITFSEIWNKYKDVKDPRTKDSLYTKSNVSKHIRELGLSDLIIVRQEKTNRRYFPNWGKLKVFLDFAHSIGLE